MPTTLNPDRRTEEATERSVTATLEATLAVLVLAPWHARLLLIDRWSTVEVLDRFPVVSTMEPLRRFGLRRDGHDTARSGFNWRIFSALRASIPADLPIVLAGDPTFVASFRGHAAEHGLQVAGVIDGVDGRASPTLLRALAQRVVAQRQAEAR